MTNDEARAAWDELVAIEQKFPVLTGSIGAQTTELPTNEKSQTKRIQVARATRMTLQDSVWGTSEFSRLEFELLESPFLQRLRRVSAAPMASLVYPSLNNTYYEHGLGRVNLISNCLESLLADRSVRRTVENHLDCSSEDILAFARIASLTKDVAHIPFTEMRPMTPHLFVNNQAAPDPESDVRESIMNSSAFGSHVHDSLQIINRRYSSHFLTSFFAGNESKWNWLLDLIESPIGIDRVDMTVRLYQHAGLPIGIDLQRLPKIYRLEFKKTKNPEDAVVELTIHPKHHTTLESFLFADYSFHQNVILHRKVRSFRLHWDSACSSLGLDLRDPSIVSRLDDYMLLERAREYSPAQADAQAIVSGRAFPELHVRTDIVGLGLLGPLVGEILDAISAEDVESRVCYKSWAGSKTSYLHRALASYDNLKRYFTSSLSLLSKNQLSKKVSKLVNQRAA